MRSLPLYKEPPQTPVEQLAGEAVDSSCRKCGLGGKSKVTCLGAEGEPGGLLVVLDAPGRDEEAAGRPLVSKSGMYVRSTINRLWQGPVAYDYAVRCPASGADVADSVEACRPYLAQTIAEVRPQRIVCMGQHAAASIMGRSMSMLDVRRGYGWYKQTSETPVPVYFFPHPVMPMRNRVIRHQWFEPDLAWALKEEVPVGADSWKSTVHEAQTLEDALFILDKCRDAAWTSIDCEWAGQAFDADQTLLSIAFTPCAPDGKPEPGGYVIGYALLCDSEVRKALKAWLEDEACRKVGSNLKADVITLRSTLNATVRGQVGDTRFMRRLLESDAKADLSTMAELIGMGGHKDEMDSGATRAVAFVRNLARRNISVGGIVDALKAGAGVDIGVQCSHVEKVLAGANPKVYRMGFVRTQLLHTYNVRDTLTTAHLFVEFQRRLAFDPELRVLWESLVLPVSRALGQVETWGMPVSRQALADFGVYLSKQLEEVGKRFEKYGPDFNPNSSVDVTKLLFGTLGLKPVATTASGKPSTDKESLQELSNQHPVALDLLRYRKLSKMKGTYADGEDGEGGLLTHVRSDGRIHPSINPDGTRTGRASSSGPNLQNIPRADTAEGKLLRDCFVAPDGWVFVELDHSQLELRIAADQSGDPAMLDIFHSGEDYHLRTAKLIAKQAWGVDPDTIDKESPYRTTSKTVNFGVLYDDDVYGLAFRLGIPIAQAQKIKDALFGRFKGLAAYIQRCVQESTKTGTARTWWNGLNARRRWLTDLGELDDKARKTARRGSWNTPIQGTGSDYLSAGLVSVVAWIRSEDFPAQVCVPIHDAILSLVRRDVLAEYLYVVPRLMTEFPTRSGVPLVVDAKVGHSWGSMEKYKLR